MSMVTSEASLVLTITAERSDTLDLLRRHASELGQEFAALGYDSIDFQFQGHGESARSFDDTQSGQSEPTHLGDPDLTTPDTTTYVVETGLDIRI